MQMEFLNWIQIVSAVLVGNGLTIGAAYFFLRLYRHEVLQGKQAEKMPFYVFLCAIIPAIFAILGVYTLV